MTIVDTSRSTVECVDCIKDAGVTTVFRYYARETRLPEKRLTRDEAERLVAAGIAIGAVFQNAGDSAACFSAEGGAADAGSARDYAASVIGQPAGSAIYFAVDYDAGDDDIAARIVPHFRAIGRELKIGRASYRVGVYGTGRVCAAVAAAGLADFTWLSNRPGDVPFAEWTLRQEAPAALCGLPVDGNRARQGIVEFGAFARLDDPEQNRL